MNRFNPEAQKSLTLMLNRWAGILDVLGVKDMHGDLAPKSVTLQGENGETLVFNAPRSTVTRPTPLMHPNLFYDNLVTATQEIDGIPHVLYVGSALPPHVLPVLDKSRGSLAEYSRTTAQTMVDLCLQSNIVQS